MANSPARSSIDVGSVIADTYTIEALLGRGGMGAVFLASHKRLPGKKVAIKMLHAEMSGEEVLARFQREAEIAARLGHPNIVTVDDFNQLPDGTPYIVLEFLEGESLAQRLKAGPLPVDQAMSIVRQVGSALAAAHRAGIVHRDLKPQNIFLVPTEVDGRAVEIAKVLDFGISKIRGSQTVKTQESALLGTPQYMAPEQATGQHASVDERTDVFALGAIVYEMLAGHPAFDGASIPEVVFKVVYEQPRPLAGEVPSLPAAIAVAVQQAMQKAAGDRYANVGAFVEALTGQPLPALRTVALPPVDSARGSGAGAKGTGSDAFAQTMDSGDHGAAPQLPGAAGPSVRGSAPTVDSQSGQPVIPPAAPSRSGIRNEGSLGATVAAAPPARRPTALIVAGVAIGAVIAASVMYFVMHPGEPGAQRRVADDEHATTVPEVRPTPADPPRVDVKKDVKQLDTPPVDVKPVDPKPVDPKQAAPKQVDPKQADPKQADTRHADPKQADPKQADPKQADATKPAAAEEERGVDPTAKAQLAEAEAALADGQTDRAERLANLVLGSESAGKVQLMKAHAIRGVIQCKVHNSAELAKSDFRAIPRARVALRNRIFEACKQAGWFIGDD